MPISRAGSVTSTGLEQSKNPVAIEMGFWAASLLSFAMNNKIRLAIAGAGLLFMLCACTTGRRNTGEWEFPLVEAGQNSVANKKVHHSSIPQKDPFRSPNVTTSLPGSGPAPTPEPRPAPEPTSAPEPAPDN